MRPIVRYVNYFSLAKPCLLASYISVDDINHRRAIADLHFPSEKAGLSVLIILALLPLTCSRSRHFLARYDISICRMIMRGVPMDFKLYTK